jgi:hypothetical protein
MNISLSVLVVQHHVLRNKIRAGRAGGEMKAKATSKEYPLAGAVSDDTTSVATDAFAGDVDRQLAGGTPSRARAAARRFQCVRFFLGAVGVTSAPVI